MHTDRYVLALAMLEGDRAARQVLADMLEEQGERGLAQWARQGRKDKRRTLEFGVMLLSCRPAVGLAAEFIGKTNYVPVGPGKRMVMTAQQWASKRVDAAEAIQACRWGDTDFQHRSNYSYVNDDRWDLLVSALQVAVEAERLAARGDSGRATAWELASLQHVRQIVRQTSGLQSSKAANVVKHYPSYVDWQTEQLQQLLKHLVASEDDLWPK